MYHFLQKKQYSVSARNEKTDRKVCRMMRPLCNDVRVFHHSSGTSDFQESMPIQGKLIFKGKEQKDEGGFCRDYIRHKDYYDLYTDDKNSMQSLRKTYEEYQHRNGVADTSFEALIKWLIDDNEYYYIGRRNNIIYTLVDIYHKIEPFSAIPKGTEGRERCIIIMALNRMYAQNNSAALDKQKDAEKYSAHLIDLVKDKLKLTTSSKEEFELFYRRDTEGAPSKQVFSVKRNTNKDAGEEFHLKRGTYVYRTVSKSELDKLLAVSDKTGNTYTVNKDRRAKTRFNPIVGGHAGNLTQAVTYGGFLVEFKMKESFCDHVMNTIAFQGEGTVDKAFGYIGMKTENEGMLDSSDRKSFSFYIRPSKASNTFLSEVESFRVLYLGKAEESG